MLWPEEALAELQRSAGHQFDPYLVEAFTHALCLLAEAEAAALPAPDPAGGLRMVGTTHR